MSELREELEAAFKDANAKKEEVDNTEVIDKLEGKEEEEEEGKKEETTAEEGKREETTAEEGKKEEHKEDPGVTLNNDKAPASWAPGIREKWSTLPADVRAEVIRREEASANGVRKLHDEYAPIRRFTEGLAPFLQEASQSGTDPVQYVHGILQAERNLRVQDPQQRFQALLSIADQYGIPLRDVINQSAGRELIPQRQQQAVDPQIQAQLAQLQSFQQDLQKNALKSEVETFKQGKEFFEDVSDIMADLFDANRVKDMADAYEQACWLHPEVRKVMIERQSSDKKGQDLKQRQTKASGASLKPSGAADLKVDMDEDENLEDTIRKAFSGASGRV